jgi:hypothetical protein
MTDSLADAILAAGVDDWVPLRAIDGLARRLAPDDGLDQNHAAAVSALSDLIRKGLVELGVVGADGFVRWPGSPQAWASRVVELYDSAGADARDFAVWSSNTPSGDQRGAVVLAAE